MNWVKTLTHDNPTYIARAVALGASGYLLKSADREKILEAHANPALHPDLVVRVTGFSALSATREG